jgi:ABC-2 type transport system ATP-binding protein
VGYLPGEFGLDVRVTGRQMVKNFARLRGLQDLGKADQLAERLGLDLDLPTGRLSRGNRQKVGLIQALFHEPALAILDEPTTGLDPLVQDVFLQLLREARTEGRTIFLSSHILSEVERVCDRVAIVRSGHLAALETTASLLERRRKRVTLVFAGPVDPSAFALLPGVSEVYAQGTTVWMQVADGIDAVIKLAARYTLVDLNVEHPSLDEVFLGYYDERAYAPTPLQVPPMYPQQPQVPPQGPRV